MCSSMDFMESAAREASCNTNILRPVSSKSTSAVGEMVSVTTCLSSLKWRKDLLVQGLMARVH